MTAPARMLLRTLRRISDAHGFIQSLQRMDYTPAEIISELVNHHGAAHGHSGHGRYYLRLATIEATCAADWSHQLVNTWLSGAERTLRHAGLKVQA